MKYLGLKSTIASLLSFTSSFNKRIHESTEMLRAAENEGLTNVRVRFAFCTWAPANNLELLARRQSRLAQSISASRGNRRASVGTIATPTITPIPPGATRYPISFGFSPTTLETNCGANAAISMNVVTSR